MSQKVLIPTKLSTAAKGILEGNGFTVVQEPGVDLVELAKTHSDTEAMILRSEKLTPEVIDLYPNLKVVVRAGAGYNTIDIQYARSKDITVMNTPGANSNAVAEEAVGMMISCARFFIEGDRSTRAGEWKKAQLQGFELTGKTVGIAGFGNIGQLLAKRLSGFDVKILVFDPFVSEDKLAEFGAKNVSLEELFAGSDFLSLHMPATKETANIISTDLLTSMKDGAVLVNCARYEILDEEALREVKKTKTIYYANDVYPKDAAGDKSIADVSDIMLPHLGASSIEANTNAAVMAANQVSNYLAKGISVFVVNKVLPDGLAPEYQELAYSVAKVAKAWMGDSQPYEINISLYGELKKFDKFLVPAIIAGASANDKIVNAEKAASILESHGIKLDVREVDDSKKYGESITVDLIKSNNSKLERLSVRGTVAEGNIIISRIDDFDKLYYAADGFSTVFIYNDRPGVLADITQILASEGINIEDLRSPHNTEKQRSIAIVKTNNEVSNDVINKINAKIDSEAAFQVSL
ncbi:3-phosphoglycerate dehydrogenase family protein [Lentisphaera marina]|uniref:3-phosphoglycerate dehydrogenase family protein n=1 Tax=Lentisphaera marina TaxID=1111041 RepID=UPI002366CE56|nr:3-phosphoglycerate dehydrogenase family protein [Lentisphaera marina]MDD7983727.1 3-phosphoglycerate dehydrogenase family protein [Lentisphaera marina]